MRSVATTPDGSNPLATEKLGKLIFKYAIPAIIAGVFSSVYNLVDQIYLGWGVGELGIAATNVAQPFSTVCFSITLLFGVGGAANMSLFSGKGDKESARAIAGNALSLLTVSGLAIGIISLVFLTPLLNLFGATELIMPYAKPYTTIVAIGFPFLVFSTGASNLIRADGNPMYSMICVVAGAIFNIIFDPIFLFAFDMGIEGIALATTLGQVLSSVLALVYFFKKSEVIKIKANYLRFKSFAVKAICKLGAVGCVSHLAMAVVQIVSNNLLKDYGGLSSYGSEIPLAAVGAVSKVGQLFNVIAIAVAQGSQPVVGYNYGAKNYSRVTETYKIIVIFSAIYGLAGMICFQVFPRQIVGIFGSNGEAFIDFTARYMRIYMMMIIPICIQAFTANFFTYIGKPVKGLVMSLSRQAIFLLPLMLILPLFLGLNGVLYASPIADVCAFILTIAFIIPEIRTMNRKAKKQNEAV